MHENGSAHGQISPFREIDRSDWSELAPKMEVPLTQTELIELRGLGDELDLTEVSEV